MSKTPENKKKFKGYVHKSDTQPYSHFVYIHPDHEMAVVAYKDGKHVTSPGVSRSLAQTLIENGTYVEVCEIEEQQVHLYKPRENPRVLRKISANGN